MLNVRQDDLSIDARAGRWNLVSQPRNIYARRVAAVNLIVAQICEPGGQR
jgi:hypothetical protein